MVKYTPEGAEARADVLDALRYLWTEDGRTTVRGVAEETGRDLSSVAKYLRQLVAEGRVVYDGPGTYRPAGLRRARYVRLVDPATLSRSARMFSVDRGTETSPGG